MVSIAIMAAAVLLIYVTQSALAFYFVASMAGFAMAGVQSVSRAMVGETVPKGEKRRVFWILLGGRSCIIVLGPSIYGWVAADFAHRFMVTQGLDAQDR